MYLRTYNAKGQRERITYATRDGNNFTTVYEYEPETFRLSRLSTARHSDGSVLQNLNYSYDPAGNITEIRDDTQQTVFFANTQVEPHCDYTYDALYRLIRAEGREHAAQNNIQRDAADFVPVIGIPFPNSPEALQRYVEEYAYDSVGNILSVTHTGGGSLRWKRCYQYALDSNRLLATGGAGEFQNAGDPCSDHYVPAATLSQRYEHDDHGNMIQMPHLPLMRWDFKDQLQATSRQVVNDGTPETTYYVYDAGGQRVRKVTERMVGSGDTPTRMKERIYLGGFEFYREYDGSGENVTLERECLHVMDDKQRVALVETLTVEDGVGVSGLAPVIRYQLGNHLGSAMLEVEDLANVITYEEYHPYGTSAYRAGRSAAEVSLKRYRYTGKEKDEETGLYYHGARYYACWLGRWTAADPIGLRDGTNVFRYVNGNPMSLTDPAGRNGKPEIVNYKGSQVITGESYGSPYLITTGRGSGGRGPVVYDDPDFIGTPAHEKRRREQGGDLLATKHARSPQENFQRSQREQAKSQQVIDELPERINQSRSMALTGVGVYTGILFAPVAVGEVLLAESAGAAIYWGSATLYDFDALQAGISTLATGEVTESGYSTGLRAGFSAAGFSEKDAAKYAGYVNFGTGLVYFAGGLFMGSQGRSVNAYDQKGPRVAVFRVEGPGNERIVVSKSGGVGIPVQLNRKGQEKQLHLNFGQEARAEEFLEKTIRRGHTENAVKEFEVPEEFLFDVRERSVPEQLRKQYPNRPQIDDPNQAEDQFGLPKEWIDLMRDLIRP
jgi:RHS repeat-associated protein